jgi:iron complex transport system ATP-binding protein
VSELELHGAGVEIEGRWLVRAASLALRPGRLTALVGPNGSGKTTLLRMFAGLWQPSEGTVTLDGRDLRTIGRRELARRVAFVPQDTHIEFAFTVRDVVAMGRHPHLGRFEREGPKDRRCIDEAMARADIKHLADRLVTELSGGERQRVVIARSLATEADAILLDEPTANLDIAHALAVLGLCRKLADDGKTVALAIHDLNAAARYATQVALVSAGCVIACGPPDEVLTDAAIQKVFGVRAERAIVAGGETMFLFHHDARTGDSNRRGAERQRENALDVRSPLETPQGP